MGSDTSQRWPSLFTNWTRSVAGWLTRTGNRISGFGLTAEVIWNSLTRWSSSQTNICLTKYSGSSRTWRPCFRTSPV
jgi:hypothetical protein